MGIPISPEVSKLRPDTLQPCSAKQCGKLARWKCVLAPVGGLDYFCEEHAQEFAASFGQKLPEQTET
jgi:hypothetical protein